MILQCVQEKREQNVIFAVSSVKLQRFWWNVIRHFLNKFASKWCKRFPPHLNNVSALPCETWNAHRTSATIEFLQKESPEHITPTLLPPNLPYLNPLDYSMWGLLQEKVYKICITDLDELKQWLRTEWAKLDHVIIVAAIRQWHHWQLHISYACFVNILLQYFPHAVINWIQICAMSISSFTGSVPVDCRDIIQVRCKTFTSFCSKFIQETVYQISLII